MFLTWCLRGSLAQHRRFPSESVTSGEAFAAMDRLLDETPSGARWLVRPEIAGMVVEVIRRGDAVLGLYSLHAFVVMPNHVHLLITPAAPVAKLLQSLKGATSRWANQMLRRTGKSFWQEETYDHYVRSADECRRIQSYIQRNPVRAGLARASEEYPWSSAWNGKAG
jgi:REP element-mobilizing transposase RayT